MKAYEIILPDGEITKLNKELSFDERKEVVDSILNSYNDVINYEWDSNKIKVFLSILTDYLYPKDIDNELSNYKLKEMNRGNKKYVSFEELNRETRDILGL